MIRGELRKLLRDRIFIGAFWALFFVHLFTMYTCEKGTARFRFVYQQREEYLAYCRGEDGHDLSGFYREDTDRQARHIRNYRDFIANMPDRAEYMKQTALYADADSYVYRNLDKSCRDFAGLLDSRLDAGNCYGIQGYSAYRAGYFFALVQAAVCVYLTVYRERECGLLLLVKGTRRGRGSLASAKLTALLFVSCAYGVLQELSMIFFFGYFYGYGDCGRLLQSVPAYRDCARKMTVQEAFLAQAGIRLLALAVAVILIYAVAMAVKNAVAGMAAAVLVFAAEYVLDILIPVSGTLNYFKCMNLFFCWDMKNTFGTYCNLNIFGFPVGKGCCAAAAAAVVCVLAACMGAVFYARTCQITAEGWVAALLGMLREKCAFLTRHTSILFYELYKVFVQQKKWIAFVTLLIWCMYESHTALVPDILTSMPDASYYNYMRQLSGRVTEEKLAWMEAEGERLADLQAQFIALGSHPKGDDYVLQMRLRSEYETQSGGFVYLEDQVNGLKQRPGSIYEKYLLDERAYMRLWTDVRHDLVLWFVSAAVTLFFLSGLYTADHSCGMDQLLGTMLHGRKTLRIVRLRCAVLFAALFYVLLELPLFLRYWKIDHFSTGMQRMGDVISAGAESSLPLAAFVGLVFAGKLAAAVLACLFGIALFVKVRNKMAAMLLGIGAAGLAAALFYYFGTDVCILLLRRL